jgi:sugar lactone lactonase YvrE
MRRIPHRSGRSLLVGGTAAGALLAGVLAAPAGHASAPLPFGTTWVADHGTNTITAYAAGADGNAGPIATIKGTNTGLSNPENVALDSAGNIYVTNFGANSVTKYAAGANGNVAPVATISGTSTGLNGPTGIAVSGSAVWVSDSNSGVLERFGTASNGNALPYASIYGASTHLSNPTAVAVAPNGLGVWAVNNPLGGTPSVTEFDAVASGNAHPVHDVTGSHTALSNPSSVAVDGDGRAWVTDSDSNAVTVYASGGNHAPLQTLAGAKTGLAHPSAIGFDALGQPTIANVDGSLRSFSATASGNTAPRRTITGASTQLSAPTGVTLYANPPSAPRDLHVAAGDGHVHLSWQAPTSSGGGIVGYAVEKLSAKPGSGATALVSVGHVSTHSTSATEGHLKNGHRYYFAVVAVNQRGLGAFSGFVAATPASTPSVVRSLVAKPESNALRVSWKAPKHSGGKSITSYRIQYATCSIGTKHCVVTTVRTKPKVRAVTLHALANGFRYSIRVAAHNAKGYGKAAATTGTPR